MRKPKKKASKGVSQAQAMKQHNSVKKSPGSSRRPKPPKY